MKRSNLLFVLLFVISFVVSAAGQPRRPGTALAPPAGKVEAGPDNDPFANFPEDGLPQPAILGLRPSADLAKSAAAEILKFDPESLSILIGALQKAGFHIIDSDQKILFRPTSTPIGAAFYDFEVAGMLRTTAFGAVTTIEKLGKKIENDPAAKEPGISALLLQDLRLARASQDPQTQFIATFIFELGKRASDLSTATPSSARINLIQASLIERLFLGDLIEAFETYSEQNALLFPHRRLFDRDRGVRFVPAFMTLAVPGTCDDIADVSKVVGLEGKTKKVAGKIFDKKSIPSILTAPKEFIKTKFEKTAKGIEGANVVMSWVKLVMANMSIKADIEVEDPIPLIRTKSGRNYGESRLLTAKFRIEFKHSNTINCVGKAIKATTGFELEVPKDGPLKNVPVKWQPVLEGSGYSRFTGYPVIVEAVDKTKGDISKQVTDDLGVKKIKVTGKPQAEDMENKPVVPLAKKAGFTVSVATENMDAAEDIPKIFWFGFEGDFGLKAFIEIIPDILAKIPLKTYKVSVPVRDWQPCSEDWGGYINFTKKLSQTIVVKSSRTSNGNSTGDGIRQIKREEEVNVVLNPRKPEDIIAKKDPRPADFRVRGKYSDITDASREGEPCCGPSEGRFSTKFRSGSETSFSGSFQKRFDLRFSGGDRDYSLSFGFITDPMDTKMHDFFEILETDCPLEYAEEKSDEIDRQIVVGNSLADGRYGQRFLNPAGDLLQGTKTLQDQDGSTVTWDWALARCSK